MRGVATVLKGINKRVIVIKNLNSEIIEEAYFILKNGKGIFKMSKENEIVIEANKIISEYHSQQRQLVDKGGCTQEAKTELEKFLNSKNEENEITYSDTNTTPPVSNLANLSDEEIFEDSKFFEHIQNAPTSKDYFHNLNFHNKNLSGRDFKSVLSINTAKKGKSKRFRFPSKSFLAGIGVMSAIVIVIKLIEYVIGI